MKVRLAFAAALVPLALLGAKPAAGEKSKAQEQFDYGLAEMLAGRFETGCPALAASQRADPRAGTLFTLGECEMRWGRVAVALRHLVAYLDIVNRMSSASEREKQGERVQIATAHRAELERSVGYAVFEVSGGIPSGAAVLEDGEEIERAILGGPVAVEPGDHVYRLALPDGRSTETNVRVGLGERVRVALGLPPPVVPRSEDRPAAERSPDDKPFEPPPASPLRTWMWISGAIGAAGVIVGGVGGVEALTLKGQASSTCSTDTGLCSGQSGADAGSSARSWANVSTVGFAVGGVGLATAAVLWWLTPSPPKRATSAWRPRMSLGTRAAWVGAETTF
jgi:hypothetical protein